MSIKNVYQKAKLYIQKYGIKCAIRKLLTKIYNKLFNKKTYYEIERQNYKIWIENNEPKSEELEMQRKETFEIMPKISIIVPMYNTEKKFFIELVNSILGQTYENFELCLGDGSPKKADFIDDIIKKDSRIKYKYIGENKGISGNTNEALSLATGEYIGLLDHDDLLPMFSLYEIVKCINKNPDVQFIYTDEDKITSESLDRYDPHFKPDFAIDTLRSNNYITHFSIFEKSLMEKIGGFNSNYDGAQDYDVIIKAAENAKKIVHIPKVLYHWRVHQNSTAMVAESKPYAYEAGIRVIEDHLKRENLKAKVSSGADVPGVYEVEYEIKGNPKVSIIIPNKDNINLLKRCIDSILKLTTYKNYEIVIVENNSVKKSTFEYYDKISKIDNIRVVKYLEKEFNYSKIINFGVKNSYGEYILQLNNDVELITKNWLEKFIGFCQREDVGAVGARLYYKDKSIQHAGIAIGIGGVAANLLTRVKYGTHGYFARECLTQNLSAVTGACLFSKRKIYEEVGYMEEDFKVAFNDVDFCLKIREKGYLIVYNPYIELMHYESMTRGYEYTLEKEKRFEEEKERFIKKWKYVIDKTDPYFNINFSRKTDNFSISTEKINFER